MAIGERELGPAIEETVVGTDETPSTTIVDLVATVANTGVTDLPPLYDAVDPEALERLFTPRRSVELVLLTYHGFDVVVRENGRVSIHDPAE